MNTAAFPRPSLAQFQDGFARALLQPQPRPRGSISAASDASEEDDALFRLTSQRGFAVYRNTVMKGYVDALLANYPAVLSLVGDAWLRAVATDYARAQPPRDARLLYYGADFPQFLAPYAQHAELDYLSAVAQLDRYWLEAHCALDASVLSASVLTAQPTERLGELRLQPHPAARWNWFDAHPIYTLWSRNRDASRSPTEASPGDDIAWVGEGALLTRPQAQVQWCSLSAGGCAFLDACADGAPLADAASLALARQPELDLAQLIATLLQAGAFTSVTGEKP